MKSKVNEILDIGLRFRFFLISFFLLSLFASATFIFDRFFLYQQLYSQVDSQLETMASSLMASGLSVELLNNFESTDDVVRDALEDQRIDRTIRLFTRDERLQFSNEMGVAIEHPVSTKRWDTVQIKDRDLRILTLKTDQYILEVGIFLQPLLVKIDRQVRSYTYILVSIFVLATVFSYWISGLIVKPVNELAKTFSVLKAEGINTGDFSKVNYDPRMKSLRQISESRDDVGVLAKDLITLFDHLRILHDKHRKDLFFIAHELKTPLAKIVFQVEDLLERSKDTFSQESLNYIRQTCRDVANFIDDYIRIAAIRASTPESLTIVAHNLSAFCSGLIGDLSDQNKDRIQLVTNKDFVAFAETAHLKSVLSNLVHNSLRYSDGPVSIVIEQGSLKVIDSGPGVPSAVLNKMGEAFNKSEHPNSSGLGLALVNSVCQLYGWKLTHDRTDQKTVFTINFNS